MITMGLIYMVITKILVINIDRNNINGVDKNGYDM